MKYEVIGVVYGSVAVSIGFCDKYLCVLLLYWVRCLCFDQFICILLGFDH